MRMSANTPGAWAAGAAIAIAVAAPSVAHGAVNSSSVTSLAAGGEQTCAVVTGGATECWGAGFDGQLGNGEFGNGLTPVHSAPVAVGGLAARGRSRSAGSSTRPP